MTIEISDKTYDEEFVKKVEEISGENFHKCMQCGMCSGGCPMIEYMDIPPRRIMILTHFGLKDKVISSKTAWICATCNACSVRCPRGVELTKVMEAIRQLTLRKNINYVEPSAISEETIADLPQIALVSCFRKHTS
ncbi:MAG: heterodisulfide reductase [Deltaproteobacteria bacterium CG2_30_43_15]|nr:MAG: heterodisulfide reductase [Deltaproteobacteria bacterium CG2_30_43_15]